jgi:uncharacterized membrane protein YdjX (TVP38/TMEM64 family)
VVALYAKKFGRIVIAAMIVIAFAFVLSSFRDLAVKAELLKLLEWIQGMGRPVGAAIIGAFSMIGMMALIPVFVVFAPASGFILGVPLGMAAVLAGVLTGSAAAFLLSRFVARGWMAGLLANSRIFKLIDKIVREKGFTYIVLLRCMPGFPASIVNYGLGLTGISFWRFFGATFTAFIPITLLFVYVGFAARSLADIAEGKSASEAGGGVLLWAGLAALIVFVVLVARAARRAIREAVQS